MAVFSNALADGGVILTTEPLGASASYTQQAVNRLRKSPPIGRVRSLVYADKAGTLYLEESEDKSTWTATAAVSVSANTTTELQWISLTKRYFRFRYVNGATAQQNFILIQQCAGLAVNNVQLTGSSIQDSQAVPMTQAQKDIVARAVDNIIDTIGAENIKLFLPLWETGDTAYDLLNSDISFAVNGATVGVPGVFGTCMSFDGINDYLSLKTITENTVYNSEYNLNSANYILAQKLASPLMGRAYSAVLALKLVGSLPSATLVAELREDSSGTPGTVVAASSEVACTNLSSSLHRWIPFVFTSVFNLKYDKTYWLTLRYGTATGVDSSNYVIWRYDSAGTYGQPVALYNGSAWATETGKSLTFLLYNDALNFSGDASVVYVAKKTKLTSTPDVLCLSRSATGSYNCAIERSSGGLYTAYGWTTVSNGTELFFPNAAGFSVYAVTYSYSKSTDKLKAYKDGFLTQKANGTANTGFTYYGGMVIGCRFNTTTESGLVNYFGGSIGPVIVANTELTAAQISKITHNLLGLKKYKVVV